MTKDAFKVASGHKIGIGGYKCVCCGPAPKHRKRYRKAARARLKAETRRETEV